MIIHDQYADHLTAWQKNLFSVFASLFGFLGFGFLISVFKAKLTAARDRVYPTIGGSQSLENALKRS
jgi:hypothetical protein